MGLRTRIKNRLTGLLGEKASPPTPAAPPPQAPVAQPPVAQPTPPPVARPVAAEAPEKVPDDKKREARLKAKKAVLQYLARQGGTANMKDMHDFSERRYFIAHKAFSDLMEEYLEEGLILFDQDSYVATITDLGRHFIETATHIKTREKD